MSVQPVAAPVVRVAPLSTTGAPAPVKDTPPTPRPATALPPAYAVTLSDQAKAAAAAHTQAPAHEEATKAARSAVARAASSAAAPQTTTGGYVLKVRAALARDGDRSLNQIMASLGIPQAEQQRVAIALGATPKSAG